MFRIFMLIFSFALGAINAAKLSPPLYTGRIVGGVETTIEEFPYQVSLHEIGLHVCGGSIVSNDTIITAAHCVYGGLPIFYKVLAGSTSKLGILEGVSVSVKEIIVHENFDYSTVDFDIAIIKLNQALSLNAKIQPISLPEEDEYPATGSVAVVTGWGTETEGSIISPINLRKVEVNIFDQVECQKAYSEYEITDRMICAGVPNGGKDACQGDSGGPLAANGKLVGVVSWGAGCARPSYPGVYSRVGNLRAWIRQNAGI